MPLTLLTGPANAGKARHVLDAFRVAAAAGRDPVLVVPTEDDVEHYRRELAQGGMVMGVRVERFAGLVTEIAQRAGMGGRPLGDVARERVAAAAPASTALSALAASATLAGFPRALAELCGELEAARVPAAALRRAAAWPGTDPSVAEAAALYAAYGQGLRRAGRPDAELHAARALDVLRQEPRRWGGTPVLIYGFDDLTSLQLDAVETLARVVDAPVTLSLAFEPGRLAFAGRAGTFHDLEPWAQHREHLTARPEHYRHPALHVLERGLFEDAPLRSDPAGAVEVLEGGGERAELELVAGTVADLLATGTDPGSVAIVARGLPSILALLTEVLDEYGIPYAVPRRRLAVSHTALGRGLLALVRSSLPQGSAADLLAWLRTPGVLERPELADRLEAELRAQGVTTAEQALAAFERRYRPLDAVARCAKAAAEGPRALLARLGTEVARLFAAPRRGAAPLLRGVELSEARAFAGIRRALDELDELARAAGGLAGGVEGVLDALLGLEVEAGDPPASDAVSVLEPLGLRARRVSHLFLCGLQAGRFPAPARPEPFLSDHERAELARETGLRLPRRVEALAAERYLFYATVSRPSAGLWLSWHSADDDGTPQVPSPFLEDVAAVLGAGLLEQARRRPLGAVGWAAGRAAPSPAAAARERARRGPRRPGATLGALGTEQAAALARGRPQWSASALEAWAACPVRWFVERHLAPGRLEPDAEPLQRGALAHAVLESTLQGLASETGSARVSPATLGRARELMRSALRERADEFPISVVAERRAASLRRLEADLDRLLARIAGQGGRFEPRHVELSFGFEGDAHPALDLGDGLLIRGRIDRVDVDPATGEALVIDYKASRAPEASKWVSDRHFQMAIYMRAAGTILDRPVVGGLYQPVSARDQRARGVLRRGAEPALDCVAGDELEEDELESLLQETIDAARSAFAEARAGALEPRPQTCLPKGRCAFPEICRCER